MKILREGRYRWMEEISVQNIVIGSGAAGLAAALRLAQGGQAGTVIVTENLNAGTSRNTGSDKQTYYKLSLAAGDPDSVRDMAEDLFDGQCVDGDQALCEAALSVRGFMSLVDLGVPFPCTEYGEYMGYKTDHDRGRRATSAGPYTSRMMTEALEAAVRQRQIPIYDHTRALKLLVKDNRVHGVLCLKQHASGASFVIFWAANIVLATGGPAAMYLDSVYPQSQLVKPTVAVITLYYAVSHWNSWFNAMLFLRDKTKYPLQLILRQILIQNDTADMTAGADYLVSETIQYATVIVATLPILCIYPFVQKYFVKGVMIGAIKG